MEEHKEIYTVFDSILLGHPFELILLIFAASTIAGIIHYAEKTPLSVFYHITSSLAFFFTWMVFCSHIKLESFYALLGVAVGSYMGPNIINMVVLYAVERIKSKFN